MKKIIMTFQIFVCQISRYEETLHQLQADLERSQESYRKTHAEVDISRIGIYDHIC